jgi:hypothetical protein
MYCNNSGGACFSLTLMSKGEKKCGKSVVSATVVWMLTVVDATVGCLHNNSAVLQVLQGFCWHVYRQKAEYVCFSLMEKSTRREYACLSMMAISVAQR